MSDIYRTLEQQIRNSSLRHAMIASNIANVDTPGYKAKEVRFDSLLEEERIRLARTNPAHAEGTSSRGQAGVTYEERPGWGDGNNVELDMEVAHMTENSIFHQAAVTLLSTTIRMYKAALRR